MRENSAMTVIQIGNHATLIERHNGRPVIRFANVSFPDLKAPRGD